MCAQFSDLKLFAEDCLGSASEWDSWRCFIVGDPLEPAKKYFNFVVYELLSLRLQHNSSVWKNLLSFGGSLLKWDQYIRCHEHRLLHEMGVWCGDNMADHSFKCWFGSCDRVGVHASHEVLFRDLNVARHLSLLWCISAAHHFHANESCRLVIW